ncbi:MAG TPA: hypothetical protein VGY48_15440 [Vicinamibacterales bacterium]|jgi:hypothetical protein|nr:hypothetical protein [Vicinamibacterales bacterium]
MDESDNLNLGDKITSMIDAETVCYATVGRIATAYECASLLGSLSEPINPDEPSFAWTGTIKKRRGFYETKNGWDRLSTEGYEWCRGHDGPAVNRLLVARGLAGK